MKIETKRIITLIVSIGIVLVLFFNYYSFMNEDTNDLRFDVIKNEQYYVEVIHFPSALYSNKPIQYEIKNNEVMQFQAEGKYENLYIYINAQKGNKEYKQFNILNEEIGMYYKEIENGYVYYVNYRDYAYELKCICKDKEYIKTWIKELLDVNYWM